MWNLAGPLVSVQFGVPVGISPTEFAKNYNAHVDSSFRTVNAADIVPILPPTKLGNAELQVDFAHVTTNVVEFCHQTGSIGGNHSCTDNYVPYLEALAAGFS